ncbi:hypothetical protein ACF0H5_021020 [Mactra antiquata]
MTSSVIYIILGSYIAVCTVLALDCYECTACVEPFEVNDDTPKTECNDGSCIKINVTLKNNVIVSRGCTPAKAEKEQCVRREEAGSVTETCYCNSDSCNGATHKTMTSPIFVACGVLIFTTFTFFTHL